MIQWSIRKHLVLLSLLPALLAAVCLTLYFTYTQLNQISESLRVLSNTTIDHLASSAEYAVFSGNTTELEHLAERILNNPSVISLVIQDKDGAVLLQRHRDQATPESRGLRLFDDQHIVISRDILTSPTPLDELSDAEDNSGMTMGTAELVVTNHYSNLHKTRLLQRSLLITAGILLLSIIIGLIVSRRIAIPLQRLTDVVRDITAGRLDRRARLNAPAELGVLEQCINRMANELQVAQTDIEERIDDFTEEFQQTLEELEIRNAQLDIARSNALQASNAKSQFLANMSHEIRTPLSGIIGFSELLDQTELEAKQKEYASIIRDSSKNLLNIIEEILDIAKIESGKIDITEGECDVVKIIDNIFNLLTPVAVDKRIELFYTIGHDVPELILSDSLRLQQILTNLIGNAIKFTSRGHVHVIAGRDETDRNMLRFRIIDTGIGLDENARDRLFTAFTQADNTISQQFGGTGLGLVISRKLTQLLDGEIGFNSVVDGGTEFWFTIPLKRPATRIDEEAPVLQGMQCLLVGNHALGRSSIASRLQHLGADCTQVDADQADTALAHNHATELVVISITHDEPVRLYRATIEHLRANGIMLPLVALTSSDNQQDIELLRAAGADVCLPRAISNFKLLEIICRHTGIELKARPDHVIEEAVTPPDFSDTNCSVMIVDDNQTNLKLASIILSKTGLDVTTAESGEHALTLAHDNHYDVIFLDIHMPDMDGYQTLAQLRANPGNSNSHIIALTAHMMPQEKQHALESGFDEIIIKPISEHIVNQVLLQWSERDDDAAIDAHDRIFDRDASLNMVAGSHQLAIEMTSMFMQQLPQHRQQLIDAWQENDIEALKSEAHTLHGSCQYISAPRLRAAVKAFETDIDLGNSDSFREHVTQVCAEIDALLELDPAAILAESELRAG